MEEPRLRLMVVVDNARYEAETEPLLPASPHALVIVTSHARLPGLEADDAVSVPLGPLKPEHSMALLRRVAGDARLSADPAAHIEREVWPQPGDTEVLALLAVGMKDDAIARQLGLSPRTVQRRVQELCERLGARTRFHAGFLAAQHDLLVLDRGPGLRAP